MMIDQPQDRPESVFLRSLGAAGTVTGSKHLLVTPQMNLMVDCGLFQGIKELREKNWEPLPVDVSSVGCLILTHAHLDHCGYIPLLVRQGFNKTIYMTGPTRDLTEIILRDCAKLQEEDADRANRHGYTKHQPAEPLYTTADVEAALHLFRVCDPEEDIQVNPQITFRFYPSAHIPGACSAVIRCFGRSILFSGDIGRIRSELLPAPAELPAADFVIMESTYGDRLHQGGDTAADLAMVINDTLFNKGNVLIPCFAVGRAQEVMHMIYRLKQNKQIPPQVPVYLDSPMAASAGKVLLHFPEWFTIGGKEVARMFSGVTINDDYRGTEQIIKRHGSKIILAASGMLTGGRVLTYLKSYLPEKRNTILLIGFQAEGTRGRALMNHAYELKVHGKYYPVVAGVREIEGLSAHADQSELLNWLKPLKADQPLVFLVHGEPGAQETLRVKIKDELGLKVHIMKPFEPVWLFSIKA